MSVFDLSSLTEEQRAITQSAIDAASFDWNLLLPGLQASVGRSYIPVEWADLSRWSQAVENADGGHAHIHNEGDTGHILGGEFHGRRAALGLAWYSGKISIEQSLINEPDVAHEVFLAEGAHMLDFFYMTSEHRRKIFAVYHEGSDTAHGHDWFDDQDDVGDPNVRNPDYWSWVGESFMSGFIFAYAPDLPQPLFSRQPWAHRSSKTIGAQIREILTPGPPPVVGRPASRVYHKPTCWVARIWPMVETERIGRRGCKLCKP